VVAARHARPADRQRRDVPRALAHRQVALRPDPGDFPWLSLHGERYARTAIRWTKFGGLLLPLGIELHRLRHTFATERLRAGMPLENLQKLLGHSTITQTLAYADITHEDVLASAARTEGVFERGLRREAVA
jgi:integrase